MPDTTKHHAPSRSEGRQLRWARNAVKRHKGKTDAKSVDRYQRAMAMLVADQLGRS